MKNAFRDYHPPSAAELDAAWKSGLISLDANVLLNLYRYSPATRDELFKLLEGLRERIWLPHQAGREFYESRLGVIEAEQAQCEKALAEFGKVLASLYSERGHPFPTKDLRSQLDRIHETLKKEVNNAKAELHKLERTDSILDRITKLLDGRVGAPFTAEDMRALYAEGAERFARGLPPGFEDRAKPGDRKFGDLVLWKQLLQEAAERKVPVLFVTDDRKRDWWSKLDGSALPALREEMRQASGELFHMYRPLQFIKAAGAHGGRKLPERTLREVRGADTLALQVSELSRANREVQQLREYLKIKAQEPLGSLGLLHSIANVTLTAEQQRAILEEQLSILRSMALDPSLGEALAGPFGAASSPLAQPSQQAAAPAGAAPNESQATDSKPE